ncbi:MAG TPA: GspH/FimT family pseudopilin [Gemmatimonadales bacterium]|jgi:prepilin-type N-terminal cleavage/methylation domain-containing protein
MKSGFTLPEVALALVVASLLLAIALPGFTALKQEVVIEQAAQTLVSAHRRARTLAITHGHPAILSVAAQSLRITFTGAGQPHWLAPGPQDQGVSVAGTPRDLAFSPLGITTGLSNATFRLTLGSATRTVVISRLGRIRILRGS